MMRFLLEYKGLSICAIAWFLPEGWKPWKLPDEPGALVAVCRDEEENEFYLYKVTSETTPERKQITAAEYAEIRKHIYGRE